MQLHFLLLVLLALPCLSVCRDLKGNMMTIMSPQFPPPPLPFRPPPSTLFTPPPQTLSFPPPPQTLSFPPPPPPLPLLPPPEPDIPLTVCSPPPPPVRTPISHCCVSVAPPARTAPSSLQKLAASTFGRISIGVIISVVCYIFFRVCRRPPHDPPSPHQSRVSRRQSSHPHSESSSGSRTTDRRPPPSPPRSEQYSFVMTPSVRDLVSDGFALGM